MLQIFYLEQGIVIKSTGSHYRILCGDGNIVECIIKGKFRVRELKNTNPIAVGDKVRFEFGQSNGSGIITELLDRKNYILRKSSNLSKQSQIIAANIDHVFLMITIIHPETPAEFIDRFLITAEAYRIPASLIINKTDLYGEEEIIRMERLVSVYEKIGYKCFRISVKNNTGLDILASGMKDKISLVAGNSGVGKTTLLNTFNPDLNLNNGFFES